MAPIILPEPMLDVYGKKLTSIHLPSGTAAILRYDRNQDWSIAAQSTTLPANKSVVLGGYFFGGWEDGKEMSAEQLSWIARNLNVLVLNNHYLRAENRVNGGITPDMVKWLKKQNPQLKYYCMLFATTL